MDPFLTQAVVKSIGELWSKETFCDLNIKVEGKRFHCDVFHLCACSGFFRDLLQPEDNESSERHTKHLTIKGIPPEIFAVVLKAIYKAECGLDEENMLAVWHSAHELQLQALVSRCESYVIGFMTLENYTDIYMSAIFLESKEVLRSALQFMAENFERIRLSPIFLELPHTFMEEIVGSDELIVTSRDHLVQSILQWVKHVPSTGNYTTKTDKQKLKDSGTHTKEAEKEEDTRTSKGASDAETHKKETSLLTACMRKDKNVTEVAFNLPKLPWKDNSWHKTSKKAQNNVTAREESLGKIFKIAKLEEASLGSLKSLKSDTLISGNQGAWTAVCKAIMAKANEETTTWTRGMYGLMTRNRVLDQNQSQPSDQEKVVVFKSWDWDTAINAYSLDSNKLFKLEVLEDVVGDLHTYNHEMMAVHYTAVDYTTETKQTHVRQQKHVRLSYPEGETIKEVLPHGSHDAVFVGNFLYCFTDATVVRKGPTDTGSAAWTYIASLKGNGALKMTVVFKDKIFLFHDTLPFVSFFTSFFSGRTRVYCLDTSTRRMQFVKTLYVDAGNVVTFCHDDHLYILQGDGVLWKVDELPQSTLAMNVVSVNPAKPSWWYIFKQQPKLWNVYLKLHGSVVHNQELVVFVDQQMDVPLKISAPLGLEGIRFEHVVARSKCHPLTVPKAWLTNEI